MTTEEEAIESGTILPSSHQTLIDQSVILELEKSVTVEEIDKALSRFDVNKKSTIIQQYKPQAFWIWRRWYGTIFSSIWGLVLFNMVWAIGVCFLMRFLAMGDYEVWNIYDFQDSPVMLKLESMDKSFKTNMSFAVFLLSFFLNQAYGFWKGAVDKSRDVQQKIYNVMSMLSSYANRHPETGQYTPEGRKWLEEVAQKLQMFHILFWASQNREFQCLLTQKGWDRMVELGFVSAEEKDRIMKLKVAPEKRYLPMFQGVSLTIMSGIQKGYVNKSMSPNIEFIMFAELKGLRMNANEIVDALSTRVPLVYVHYLQVLVDSLVLTTPFAKYGVHGLDSVVMTMVLTVFFQGLVVLAKVLFDPFDQEDYSEGCMYFDVGVLIREVNYYTQEFIHGAELSM